MSYDKLSLLLITATLLIAAPAVTHAGALTKPANNLGLVGYWSLNEGAGTQAGDFSGSGNDVTPQGGYSWVDGRHGKALKFDGSSGTGIDLEHIWDDHSQSATVSFFFKENAGGASSGDRIVSQDCSEWFCFNDDGTDEVRAYVDNSSYVINVDESKWHHGALVFDVANSVADVYIDGELKVNDITLDSWNHGARPIVIGGNTEGYGDISGSQWEGTIDEVRIYHRVLSQSEIQDLYQQGLVTVKASDQSSKVAHWKFDRAGNPDLGSSGDPAESCGDIKLNRPDATDGDYYIDPDGVGGNSAFQVYCDMADTGEVWTRLNLRNDAHTGAKGLCFGSNGCNWAADSEANWGQGQGWFQRSGNHRCTVYSIGDATTSLYGGKETLWDYYDANGNAIAPDQIKALSNTTAGTYYSGQIYVNDIDGPFPDGGDGDSSFGVNSFNMQVDSGATHAPTGGGPIALWFSNSDAMNEGTTHVLANDRDSGEDGVMGTATYKTVHSDSIPRFMGGKVDNDANLYSDFWKGCEEQSGSTFEMENPYFWVKEKVSVPDNSGQENSGIIKGNPQWADGKRENALDFDGSDDYVKFPDSPSIDINTGGLTLSGWVQTTNSDGYPRIMSKAPGSQYRDTNGYQIDMSGGSIGVQIGDGADNAAATLSGPSVNDGNWHHAVLTWDGSNVNFYVDNKLEDSTTWSGDISNSYPFVIGAAADYGNNFPGKVDDARIYNQALSESRIKEIYQNNRHVFNASQNNKLTNGLVGMWSFDGKDLTTATATDVSGNNNDGTLNGPTPAIGKVGQGLKFDGSNDWIDCGDLGNPGAGSISLWFKKDNTSTEYLLDGRGTGNWWFLTHYNGYDINFDNYVTYNGTSPDTWYHVVVASDSSGSKMYVNGNLVDSGGGLALDFRSVRIGTRYTNSAYLSGKMDEVRIYDRILTTDEVQRLYNMGR